MAKVTKIADKLAKVNDNFSVNMYDNGFNFADFDKEIVGIVYMKQFSEPDSVTFGIKTRDRWRIIS